MRNETVIMIVTVTVVIGDVATLMTAIVAVKMREEVEQAAGGKVGGYVTTNVLMLSHF